MNPAAILSLISMLYEEIAALQARVNELEAESANGDKPAKDFAAQREG